MIRIRRVGRMNFFLVSFDLGKLNGNKEVIMERKLASEIGLSDVFLGK